MLNRWYAGREGLEIETVRSDAADYAAASAFDAICTHSFIGQFDPQQRLRLLAAWRRQLRPGGLLLTINRLRSDAAPGWLGYSPQQAAKLAEHVRQGAGQVSGLIGASEEELAQAALAYARRMGAWPIRSIDEIRALCEASAFRVEHLSSAAVVLPAGGGLSAPTVPGGAPYAHLAARRV
jgi:SAM-dependent methyltransferase